MIELISIHIPKTGGTSFYNVLKQVYGNQLSPSYKRKDVKEKDIRQMINEYGSDNTKVMHGHFHYNEVKSIHKSSNAKVICWLRNPVDRLISNHKHFIKRNSLAERIRPNQHRINESLLTFAHRNGTRNVMSKFLNGIELREMFFIGFLETFEQDLAVLSKKLDWPDFNIPILNATPKESTKISNDIRLKIKSLNLEDFNLYKEALSMRNL